MSDGKSHKKQPRMLPPAPIFVQEIPPAPMVTNPRTFKYEKLLDTVREHPNAPAIIARVEDGARSVTSAKIGSQKNLVRAWLDKNRPLELWELVVRRDESHWSARELYVVFRGYMTPAEAEAYRQRRREAHQDRQAKVRRNREAREARERVTDLREREVQRRRANRR